ncbi:hypothetical protein [Gymnodinialimonas hymeniacidonis]|uniref:hypothetical protein n=1 Tax=Gymnodinialimonas hymeniacidonis TaxID=3126508 RepID=UPI0034C64FCC
MQIAENLTAFEEKISTNTSQMRRTGVKHGSEAGRESAALFRNLKGRRGWRKPLTVEIALFSATSPKTE